MLDEFEGQLIVVEHHVDDVLEIPWTEQRSSWYWASSKPHVRVDGIYLKMGATSCASAAGFYRTLIEQRLAETDEMSPIRIGGGYWFEGDSLKVVAAFTLLDAVTLTDTQAHVIISEDDVWESGIHLDHLTRAAVSQDVTLTEVEETVTAPASFCFDPIWNPDRLRIVACLQQMGYENEDKGVHQATFLPEGFSGIPDGLAAATGWRLSLAPNPFVCRDEGDGLSILLSWAAEAAGEPIQRGEIRIVDALGRMVSAIPPLEIDANTLRARWDGRAPGGSPLPAGPYWLQAQTRHGNVSRRVVILK